MPKKIKRNEAGDIIDDTLTWDMGEQAVEGKGEEAIPGKGVVAPRQFPDED
jgi:hypothetical protein